MDNQKIVRLLLGFGAFGAFAYFAAQFVSFHSTDPIIIPFVGQSMEYQPFAYALLGILVVFTAILYIIRFNVHRQLSALGAGKKEKARRTFSIHVALLCILILMFVAGGLLLKANYSSDKVYDVEAKV